MGRYSSSDSDHSRGTSSKRKKKSRKRRSRSSSYDESRKKQSRSRRSRSSSSERGSSALRRKRSRSRDRPRHHDRKKKSRDRSPSPVARRKKHVDAVTGVTTGTLKDVMDIVPGFSKMAPAEQSRIRIQRALKTAVETSKVQEEIEKEKEKNEKEENEESVKEQIDRAKAIQAIEDADDDLDVDFIPSHFRSSSKPLKKSEKSINLAKKSYQERESFHENAIFGHSSMLTIDQALKEKKEQEQDAMLKAKRRVDFNQRDPRTLCAPELLITPDEAAARWRSKLISLRDRFMKEVEPAS